MKASSVAMSKSASADLARSVHDTKRTSPHSKGSSPPRAMNSPPRKAGASSHPSNASHALPASNSHRSQSIANHTEQEQQSKLAIKLRIPRHTPQQQHQYSPPRKNGTARNKPDRRPERKSTVRKEEFDLDPGSDLTDAPSSDDNDGEEEEEGSESDAAMEAKLLAAGDGESLLGSGISDDEDEKTEEQLIIEEAKQQEAKARARVRRELLGNTGHGGRGRGGGQDWGLRGQGEQRGRNEAVHKGSVDNVDVFGNNQAVPVEQRPGTEILGDDEEGGGDADDEDDPPLSPETMRLLGLPVLEDELFEEQEGFHSSSEPSFTDFFASSDESTPENDDDDTTTDDDSDDEISDLEAHVLGAPFLAHIATAEELGSGAGGEITEVGQFQGQEVPLLVIEDLDGRLIYARAHDGEAVFGSDGEFEFADDSDEDDTDLDLGPGATSWRDWDVGITGEWDDEGETTDELPDEDMPFPRLLVGSVAPRGGRSARRAHALAAKSRRLSPSGVSTATPGAGGAPSTPTNQIVDLPSEAAADGDSPKSAGSSNKAVELNVTISTEALAKDPQGTIAAAAESLGISVGAAARLVAGVEVPTLSQSGKRLLLAPNSPSPPSVVSATTDREQGTTHAGRVTPEPTRRTLELSGVRPEMGSFMPASSKSVHRAVIDGSNKAPSPFSGRTSLQSKGLAKRRRARRDSSSTHSSKRPRRYSGSGSAMLPSAAEDASEVPSSPELTQIGPMDLDDVVDADMLWRGAPSKSPSVGSDGDETDDEGEGSNGIAKTVGLSKSPMLRAKRAKKMAKMNLNAFARWDRIPMAAFRDTQGSSNHHPSGTLLLTRSQGSSSRKQTQSPFRGRPHAAESAGDVPIGIMRSHFPGSSLSTTLCDDNSKGRNRNTILISPVLFPVRNGDRGNGDTDIFGQRLSTPERFQEIPHVDAQRPRKMTKREKRERKARRAALKNGGAASVQGGTPPVADGVASLMDASRSTPAQSPAPSTPGIEGGAPSFGTTSSAALPKLRITDASPRASPGVGSPAAFQRTRSLTPGEANGMPSSSMADSVRLPDAEAPHTSTMSGPSHHDFTPVLNPPSSACRAPLHSPLFGGIFPSLGFADDLDDREGENSITI